MVDGGLRLGLDADFIGDPTATPLRCNYFEGLEGRLRVELEAAPPGFSLENPSGTFPLEED